MKYKPSSIRHQLASAETSELNERPELKHSGREVANRHVSALRNRKRDVMETEARKIARGSEISCSLESEPVVADNSKTLNEIVDESSLSTKDELHGVYKEENVKKEEEAEKEEGIIIEKRSEEEEQQENEEEETEVEGVKEKEEEIEGGNVEIATRAEEKEEEESVEEETQTEVLMEEKEEAAGKEGEQEENKENKKEKEEEDKQEEEEFKEEEEIHSKEIKEEADENVGKPDKAAGVEEHIKEGNGGEETKPELIKEEVENESGEKEEKEKQEEEDKGDDEEKEYAEENECRKIKELLKEEDQNEVEINEKGNEEDADIMDNLEKWLRRNSKEGEYIKEKGEKVKEEEKEIEKEEKDDRETEESVEKDDEQKKEVEIKENYGVEGEEGNKEAANRMKSRDSISQVPIMEEPKEGKEEAVKEKNKKFEEKEKQENERVDEKEIYKIGEREMEKEEMEVSIGGDEEQKEAIEEQEKEAVGGEEGSEEAVNRMENHGSVNQAPSPEEPLSRNLKAENEDGRVEEESRRVEEKEIGKIEKEEVVESIGEDEEQKEDVEWQKKKGEVENEVAGNGMKNHASANQTLNLEEPYCNDPTEGVNAEECDASDDSAIPRDPAFEVRIVEEKQNSVCIDWTPSPEAEVYKIEKFHRRRGWEQVAWVGYAPTTVSDLAENFTYRLRIKAQRFCEARGLFEDYKMSPDFLVTTLSPLPTTLSLHRAIKKGQQFLVKRILRRRPSLLEHPGPNGYLPLANAIIDGQNSVIDVLLSHGGNVQIGNPLNARTPLQLAFYYGRLAVARILLNRKAQLEAVDINDMTACHFAVDANQLELLRFALENGANVNATDACGWSLLSRAVVMGSDVCVLKLLLTHGADPKSKDKMGKTCVDLAEIYKNTVATDYLAKALRSK